MATSRYFFGFTFGLLISLADIAAWAHAFPDHSTPSVGATLTHSPAQVRIWFDDDLEPGVSKLRVTNSHQQEVTISRSHVDKSDPKLLEIRLRRLPPGTYHVYWSVADRDGHHTQGDYTYTVNPH